MEVVRKLPIRAVLVPVNRFSWCERLVTKATVAISNVRIIIIEHKMEKLLNWIKLFSNKKYPLEIILLPKENFSIILIKLHIPADRFINRTKHFLVFMGLERVV